MKFFSHSQSSVRIRAAQFKSGFTLPEVLIATTLFLLLLGGIVGANLFGMRLFQLTESKLRSSDGARKALGVMTDEIRKCKATWVGDVTNGAFVALADGLPQTGSALLIQPTSNTNNFVIYYLNPPDQSFRRVVTSTASTTILAQTVTNSTIFCAQDFQGNALTNNQNNHVIHATLEFFQPQQWLPVADYSKLETSVSRRSLQ
jgi:prepilin-type N-terminal cleavage/methylation domain-containing protein